MKTLVFEGFIDTLSGWEFGLPAFVLAPYKAFWLDMNGASVGDIDRLIDDHMVDMAIDHDTGEKLADRRIETASDADVERAFEAAKRAHESGAKLNGKYKGVRYWKRVVEYDETWPDGVAADKLYGITESVGP